MLLLVYLPSLAAWCSPVLPSSSRANTEAPLSASSSCLNSHFHYLTHTHTHTHTHTDTSQAIFDTDPKLDHAPIVLYCASSAIKESHSMAITDIQWIPNHIQLSQRSARVLENPSRTCNQIISSSIDG